MNTLFIPIILGTAREGNYSKYAAEFVKQIGESSFNINTVLIDAKDFPPFGNKRTNEDYEETVKKADGFFIVAPEYNHGYSGYLKILLDKQLKNYAHKPVAIAGISASDFGGARMIENLLPILHKLGLHVTLNVLYFSKVTQTFSEKGILLNKDTFNERVKKVYKELIWMATTLKEGRKHLES